MGFLECSFSPPVWLLRKSISGKHFFFLLGHRMGPKYHDPMEPMEPVGAGPGMEKFGPNLTHCHSYTMR